MIAGISLIVLSIIALSSFYLVNRKSGQWMKKVAILQGFIGLLFCYWGISGFLMDIFGIQRTQASPVLWMSSLVIHSLYTTLGFLLGCGMISVLVFFAHEDARQTGARQLKQIAVLQGDVGVVGLIVGLVAIILM